MGLYFSILASVMTTMLVCIFFSKEKVKNAETKTYGYILITTEICILFDLITGILFNVGYDYNSLLYKSLSKVTVASYIIWASLFTLYIKIISSKNIDNKNYRKAIIIMLMLFLISLLLPFDFNILNDKIIPSGLSTFLTYIIASIEIIYFTFLIIKNFKIIDKNKLRPVVFFVAFMIINFIIQQLFPDLFLINFLLSLVIFIMYNTIENPDIKLVEYEQKEREKIIAAAESKSEFLSSTSHELRTPLNAIIGLSEDIQSFEDMNSEIIDDTKDLINASNALLDIISNILDSSKIESGKLDVVECDYDSRKEYEALGNIYRIKAFKNKLQFDMSISDGVPKVLYGDKQRVKQIISNLLDNAVKFTDVGRINFKIDWNNLNNMLIISVSDTGNGLSEEETNKFLFDTEELKIEKVYSTKGTGLGLSITKNLIKILGGKAKVESKSLAGTKFIIYIPQKLGNEKALEESEAASNINVNNLDFSGKRLLVVDDNVINIKVLRKAIKTFNFEVDECYNGKDAIDKIELNNNYDLVLMDIMMPVMGGEEAIGLLRQKSNFTTPVIALTADAVSGAKEKYTKMGFNDYMSKPFSRETVAKKISLVLGNGVK